MNLKIIGTGIMIIGIGICIFGTGLAVLFVPCKVFGQFVGWGFILECRETWTGKICAYHMLDLTTLLLELIFINGVGITLVILGFFVRTKQKQINPKKRPKLNKELEIEELE